MESRASSRHFQAKSQLLNPICSLQNQAGHTYLWVMSQMSCGRMFKTATRRSAMERWYMRWYIRDDGFLRSCLRSATSTIPLLNRATKRMTACKMDSECNG